MTNQNTGNTTTAGKRMLGLIVMGVACMAPAIASAQDHRPPPPHHVVHHVRHCKNVRVSDHHGHYHTVRQCR